MANLTTVVVSRTAAQPTPATVAGGGDAFTNTGKELLSFLYTSGTDITVTIPAVIAPDGLTPPSKTFTISSHATKRTIIGPFPTLAYNDANGRVNMTYSGGTVGNLSVDIIQLTNIS